MNNPSILDRAGNYLYKKHLSRFARPFAPYLGQILMFHRVVESDGGQRLPENQLYEITPQILRDVIKFYLHLGFDFLSLDEMMDRLNTKKTANRFVTFTFDDGYTDTLTTALPVLKEAEIPFCLYITTDFPDRKAMFWWDILEDSLIQHNEVSFTLDGKDHVISCRSLDEKREAFQTICTLVMRSPSGVSAAWRAIFAPLSVDFASYTERLALSWDQIIDIGRDPLATIGAHTCSHPPLAGLTEEEARNEMGQSRDIIRQKTGLDAVHFSYPYGSKLEVTDREARLAAELGFHSAVTTETGNVYRNHHKKAMRLPRLNVNRDNWQRDLTLAVDGCLSQTFNRP